MLDPKNNSIPNLVVAFCIALICSMVLVPFVNQIYLPLGDNKTGAISVAAIENISPYTDYVKYLILLLAPPLLAAIALAVKGKWVEGFLSFIQKAISHPSFCILLTTILISSWTINQHFLDLQAPLLDSFHEGEWLGFLPNFLYLENPFVNTLFIHGFGLNVLPSLVANEVGNTDNIIVTSRLFISLLRIISVLGWFWVLWEIADYVKFQKRSKPLIFMVLSLLFAVFEGIFFFARGTRAALFVIQFALTLRFFKVGNLQKIKAIILATVVGLSVPISFFYVYDRAVYFVGIYLTASALSFKLEKRLRRLWLAYSTLGIAIAFILLLVLLGVQPLAAVGWQIIYWAKYGRYISFLPLPPLQMTFDSQWFWLSIWLQTSVLVYLTIDLTKARFNLRSFVQNHFLTLLLLSASCIHMRIALDRSDITHAGQSAIVSFMLLFYLILLGLRKYLDGNPQIPSESQGFMRLIFVTVMLVLLASEPNFQPQQAWQKIAEASQAIAVEDEKVVRPDYWQAVNAIKPEIEQQSCFYTLTSEGVWYYLFDKPSCSKFSYTYYAKPTKAQEIVVGELQETKPEVVLLTNDILLHATDGIPTSDSVAQIYQYIIQEYRPYRLIESHWFWKRSDRDYSFGNGENLVGAVDSLPENEIWKGQAVFISGWAVLPQQNKPIDAVFLSYGLDNKPIAVDRVNTPRPDVALALSDLNYSNSGWKLRVPTTVLPTGDTVLKVWGYHSQTQQLTQIGKDIPLKVLSSSDFSMSYSNNRKAN